MIYSKFKISIFKNNGFTLIEMIVTVFIFSVIVGAAIGVFVSTIRFQRYNLTYQQLLSQTSYAMEYMSRAIRMAKKDTDGSCIEAGKNYQVSVAQTSLRFENYKTSPECQEFSLELYQLMVEFNSGGKIPLISDNFDVTSLKFEVSGDQVSFGQPADTQQPRVTIFMEIQAKGTGPQPKIKIQTTISQRNLDA